MPSTRPSPQQNSALSSASLVELSIVMEACFGADGQGDLDLFLNTALIDIISLDREQAERRRLLFLRPGQVAR